MTYPPVTPPRLRGNQGSGPVTVPGDLQPTGSTWGGQRMFDFVCAIAGCTAVAVALVMIWAARVSVEGRAYVSELGADGASTAASFELALLLIVAGGGAIAWAGRGIRSTSRLIGFWPPAVSIAIGCSFFLVASQVTCTGGCPLPMGETFTWQDFAHTVAAVLAFAASCFAMFQAAFAEGHPASGRLSLARLSMAWAVAVAVIAGIGGLLSVARVGTFVGGILELIATTLAIGWLIAFGLTAASRVVSASAVSASRPSA